MVSHHDVNLLEWSLLGRSFIRVVSHQDVHLLQWSLIRMFIYYSGLSSGCSFITVVSHQDVHLLQWSLIRMFIYYSGLSSGCSFITVASHQDVHLLQYDLSSEWPLIKMVSTEKYEIFEKKFICQSLLHIISLSKFHNL